MKRRRMRRLGSGALAVAVTAALAGCGMTIPSDVEGTLDAVTGGVLEVGVTPNPPYVDTSDEQPTGSEVDLVTSFADSVGATLEWTEGSEQTLVGLLEAGEIDLVIGGLTDDTPWSERAALTRAYAQAEQADGSSKGLVMLAPMGENAFLSALERHLDAETAGRS
ncbi:transporter substrate-binding domain-containing protein [Agrococcus sp. KRD186]|uniref:transporter substrate-binding domain-containing protein n=1 Tax=Agrococcus sp. KRD186 TaxID=2729730 RepID=UPI001F493E9B|nr:transporter substrate-binding domain-containing protein [Agrococcus sp. KRD186]